MGESQEEIALEKLKDNENVSTSHECKICHEKYESLQDVLKHELVTHSASKNVKRLPANKLKRRVNAVLKTINGEDEKKLRQGLVEAIIDCDHGTELDVIFKKYLMNDEDLAFIFSRVHTCLQAELDKIGSFSIEPFGSVTTGLALKTSDIDLHISSHLPDADPNYSYKIITKMLFRSKCFTDVHPIRKARVPIIKCIHKSTGFSLDINTSEVLGVHNSQFIADLIGCDTRIRKLMMFMKIWSNSMHMHGAFNMTNYCLITLVIFYLQHSTPPVLPSVKILQRNAKKHYVNGVNFGLNLRGIPMDTSQNVHQLIKGFFAFYSTFDFQNLVISPYLGRVIKRMDLKNKQFRYPEYEEQLHMFATMSELEELQIDRPVCVQDMFCLNINVGKCLSEPTLQYFKKCVTLADRKCCELKISMKKLYKSLLVEIIEEITDMFPADGLDPSNTSGSTMSFDIIPRKNEVKSLAKFATDPLELQKLWAKEYIDAVEKIIGDVYRIDMTLLSKTQNNKCKKLDETDSRASPLPRKWAISCQVDLWSARQMQKNNTTASFMDYQLEQTETLSIQRRQNSNFAVQFKGYLTITIIKNYGVLHVELSSTEQLCKKDPLRKFFSALKCSMQNYNLKQRIHQLEKESTAEKHSIN